MARFSNDVDLLKWEPVLFRELAIPSQMLCRGTDGVMNGTTFTSAGAAFTDAAVTAGQVIYLNSVEDAIDGCYEIVSVDSVTQLTVSVVRQSSDDDAIGPPNGNSISYRISTFDPQTEEVAFSLLQYFGVDPSDDGTITIGDILDSRALRQASVFAVLSAVFASSACKGDQTNGYWQKSLRYQKLYHTARVRSRLKLDTNDDGVAEQVRYGGTVRLRRF